MNRVAASCAALVAQLAPAAAAPVGGVAQPPTDAASLLPGGSMMIAFIATAVMVTMINLVALCGSCFGGKKTELSADDDDTIVACARMYYCICTVNTRIDTLGGRQK